MVVPPHPQNPAIRIRSLAETRPQLGSVAIPQGTQSVAIIEGVFHGILYATESVIRSPRNFELAMEILRIPGVERVGLIPVTRGRPPTGAIVLLSNINEHTRPPLEGRRDLRFVVVDLRRPLSYAEIVAQALKIPGTPLGIHEVEPYAFHHSYLFLAEQV